MNKLLFGLLLLSGGLVYGMEQPLNEPTSPRSLQELALDKSVKDIEEALWREDLSIEGLPEYFQQKGMLVGHYLPIVYRLIFTSNMLTVAEKAQLAQVFTDLEDIDELDRENLEFLHRVLSEEKYALDQTYKGTLINELALKELEEGEEEISEEEGPEIKITLLHEAVQENLYSLVLQLLAEGFDVMARTSDGHTPLHDAAGEGFLDIIKLLIDRGADVNARSEQGHTPLYEVISNLDLENTREVMDFLFKRGAELDAKDNGGYSLIIIAAKEGNKEAIEFLIDNGIDPNTPADREIANKFNEPDNYAAQAIHQAANAGTLEVIDLLLNKGVDINALDANGQTPLYWALDAYQPKSVEFLIQKGANLNIKDKQGDSPLDYALLLKDQKLPGFKPIANLKTIQLLLCKDLITDEMVAQERAESSSEAEIED